MYLLTICYRRVGSLMQRRSIVALRAVVIFLLVSSCAQAQVELIQLKSKEGTIFEISKDAAFLSSMIMDLAGDFPGRVITFDKMNDVTLSSVIKCLNQALVVYSSEIPGFTVADAKERKRYLQNVITPLSETISSDIKRAKEPIGQAVVFIIMGDYLAFPELMEAACKEASKLVSWKNIRSKYWRMLTLEMQNRVAYYFFPFLFKKRTNFLLFRDDTDPILEAKFSSDGTKIATQSFDVIKLWDAQTGQHIRSFYEPIDINAFYSFDLSPDNTKMVIVINDNASRLYDIKTGQRTILESHVNKTISAKFSPDSKKIITGSSDNTAKIWDANTGNLIHSLEGHSHRVNHVQFSPDNKKALTGSDDDTAKIWNVETGQIIHTLTRPSDYQGIDLIIAPQFNNNGSKILISSEDGYTTVWNTETGQRQLTLHESDDHLVDAKFSPDGTKIVTVRDEEYTRNDRKIKVWKTKSGRLIHSFKGHTNEIYFFDISADSKKIITLDENTAKVWDIDTGRLLFTFGGPDDEVNSATFSPDGLGVLTVSDGVRLWDISRAQYLKKFDGLTIVQVLYIVSLLKVSRRGKPTFINKLVTKDRSKTTLKKIFKSFDYNQQQMLIKTFNIREEPPEEIFKKGREQLGL